LGQHVLEVQQSLCLLPFDEGLVYSGGVAKHQGQDPSELIVEAQDVKITDGVTKSASGVGWYCKVCDCFLKDSLGYLDHINGKKHQRALGYTMRVEQSTVSGVKGKLAELKARKEAEGKAPLVTAQKSEKDKEKEARKAESEAERLLREKEEAKARKWEEKKRKREEKRKAEEAEAAGEDGEGMDPAMAAMMGFSGFGGK